MHPYLAPHLHTPECNKLIDALHNCHKTVSCLKSDEIPCVNDIILR